MTESPTPLVMFSLQRSGSTLVQRILGAHPEIMTASETHLLLPYLYALRDRGVYGEYSHQITSWAIQDFVREMPGGRDDYLKEVGELARRLYERITQGQARYFLDKAALYHLVVEDIIQAFPDGKFIFLWRNPLAVVASFMDSWEGGRWNIYHYEISLYRGLANMIAAYQKHQEHVCSLRFEDVVSHSEPAWRGIFDYLDLEFDPAILENFSQVKLKGRVGDQWGTKKYNKLSTAPIAKWKLSLANPLRRRWARNYVLWLGQERLAVMGYDQRQLLDDLDSIPFNLRHTASDLVRFPLGMVYRLFEFRMLKHKLQNLRSHKRLYIHT